MVSSIKIWADNNLKGDRVIWAVVFALSLVSILVVYSSIGTLAYRRMVSPERLIITHTLHVIIGLVAMWLAHRVDYRYYSGLSKIGLWLSVPLLIFTFTNGVTLNDAARWIQIPVINTSFQPSDFAGLCLIVNLASMLAKRQQNISDIKESLIPILFWCGVICGLIALTNLSTAILLLLTCMLTMFIGRVPARYLAMLMFVGVLFGALGLKYGVRGETAMHRVTSFIQGDELPFQARHARIAVASGGITGKGPGNSDQRNILPHPYSDFIFAIIIEEYGLVGGVTIVLLYLVLLHRGMKAAYKSERAFGGLLSAGLSFDLVCQALVNMGVVVGLGPITGQPLPLISMGGTSMVFSGLALGIILSVSRGEQEEFASQADNGGKRIMTNKVASKAA